MSDYFYGQFTSEHLLKTRKGIELYNEQKYWECHEFLEDHWFEDMGDTARYVYWAIIQVACSMIHYRDENLAGAQGMLKKAKDKFIHCEKKNVETPVMYNELSWKELKKLVFDIPEDSEIEGFEKLFQFRFKNPSDWSTK